MSNLQFNRVYKKDIPSAFKPGKQLSVNFTETGELFINKQNGNVLKISDVVSVPTENDLSSILLPDENKIYLVTSNGMMLTYDPETKTYRSPTTTLSGELDTIINKIPTLEESIDIISRDMEHINDNIDDSLTASKKYTNEEIIKVNKYITDEVVSNIVTNRDDINKHSDTLLAINNTIIQIVDDIETIGDAVTTLGLSTVPEISKKVNSLVEQVSSASQSIVDIDSEIALLRNDIGDLNRRLTEKKFSVDFVITDALTTGYIKDFINIESFVFEQSDALSLLSVNLNCNEAAVAPIKVAIDYVSKMPDGSEGVPETLVDMIITEGGIEKYEYFETVRKFTSGKLKVNIKENGNSHIAGAYINIKLNKSQTGL